MKHNFSGFTMIEIMIVSSLFLVIMGIAFTSLKLNETFRDLVFVRIQLYRQNRLAHEVIAEEMQMAQAKPINRINITDNTGSPDEVRFQVPLPDKMDPTTYEVPWGATWRNQSYYPDYAIRFWVNNTSSILYREVVNFTSGALMSNATREIKATNIVDLQFNNTTPNYINITTRARKVTIPPGKNITDSLESFIYLLNSKGD